MQIADRKFLSQVLRFSSALSFYFVGAGLTQPIMSIYTSGFVGTSYLLVGALISTTGLVKAGMNPVSGFLSDTVGRKRLSTLGALTMSISLAVIALATSSSHLLVSFIFFGMGQAFFFLSMMTSMVEIAGPARLALTLGIYEGGSGASILLGSALSGFVSKTFGMKAVFGVAATLTFTSFLICRFLTVETLHRNGRSGGFAAFRGIRKLISREYFTGMFCAFMYMYSHSLFTTVMPLYVILSMGVPLEMVPLLFIGFSGTTSIGSFMAGPISDRIGRRRPLAFGIGLLGLGFAALPFLRDLTSLVLASLSLGFGSGFFHPIASAIIADVSTPENRGKAYGFYRLARDSGSFAGPAVSGVVSSLFGVPALFGLSATLSLVGALLASFFARETLHRINVKS